MIGITLGMPFGLAGFTRFVDLQPLRLSEAVFSEDDPSGSVIGAVEGLSPGSTLSLEADETRVALDGAGNLIIGMTPSTVGNIRIVLHETLATAFPRHRETVVTVTIAPGRYMIAANRFILPVDWGIGDQSLAPSDNTGRSGGNGTVQFRYFFRRWKFSTGFGATQGRFLWQNSVNGLNGIIDGLFSFTIQRAEVRDAAKALVASVSFDGQGSKVMQPGEICWSDALPDLAADSTYYLDLFWTIPDGAAFPTCAPQYLSGEIGAASLTNDYSLSAPPAAAGMIASNYGGSYGPSLFAAKGGAGQAAAMLFGDSLLDFTNVAAKLAPARGDIGHIQQALGAASAGVINYASAARYSTSFATLYRDDLNGSGARNIFDWLKTASDLLQPEALFNLVICAHGRNSMTGSQTLSGMLTLRDAVIDKLQALYPGMPYIQTTTTPCTYVTGSSDWTTEADQVFTQAGKAELSPANLAGGTLQQWNAYNLANSDGRLALCLDTAAACRSATNAGKWKVPGRTTTLLDAVAASGTSILRLADALQAGDTLCYEPGTANAEFGKNISTVVSVTAAAGGGYNHQLTGGGRKSYADAASGSYQSMPAKAHAAGAVIAVVATVDGLHPAHAVSMEMRDIVLAQKAALVSAARAYAAA